MMQTSVFGSMKHRLFAVRSLPEPTIGVDKDSAAVNDANHTEYAALQFTGLMVKVHTFASKVPQ
jgi:hypothetical protein